MPALLGDGDQRGGHRAHLGDPAGHALGAGRRDGLHRVEHEQTRLDRVEVAEDRFEVGLGGQEQPLVQRAEPLGAQPDLADRLLAARSPGWATRRRPPTAGPRRAAGSTCRHRARRRAARPRRARCRRRAPGRARGTPVGLARAGSTLIVAIGRAGSGGARGVSERSAAGSDRRRRWTRRSSPTRRTRGSGRPTSAAGGRRRRTRRPARAACGRRPRAARRGAASRRGSIARWSRPER